MYWEKLALISRYQYVIALENAELDEWVNERLYHPLMAGTVPIYAGAGGLGFNKPQRRAALNRRLPHPDSIVYVGDYKNVAQLGMFLLARTKNSTLYAETHLRWREAFLRERIELVARRQVPL